MSSTLEEALNNGMKFAAPDDVATKLSASMAFAHRYFDHPEAEQPSTRFEVNTGLDEQRRDFAIYNHPEHGATIAISHGAYEALQRAARGVPMGDAAARQSAEKIEGLHQATMARALGVTSVPAAGSPLPSMGEWQAKEALVDAAVLDSRQAHAEALGLGDRVTSIIPRIPTPSAGAQLHDTASLLQEQLSSQGAPVRRVDVLRTLGQAALNEHAPIAGPDNTEVRPAAGVGVATAGIRNALANLIWRAYGPEAQRGLGTLTAEGRQEAYNDVSGAIQFQDRDPGKTGWEGPVQLRPGVTLSPRQQQQLNGTSHQQGTNLLTALITAIRSRWGVAGTAGISGYLRMNAGLQAAVGAADRLGLPRAHPLMSVAREGTATVLKLARLAHARTRGAAKSAAGGWLGDARRADRGVRNHEFMERTAQQARQTAGRVGDWLQHEAAPAAGRAALVGGAFVTAPIWGPPVLAYKAGRPVVQAAGRAAGRAAKNAGDVLSQPAARPETSLQDLDEGHAL